LGYRRCAGSVTIGFFFEGLDDSRENAQAAIEGDFMADKEALELVRSYYAIPEAQRRRLFDLARVLSRRGLSCLSNCAVSSAMTGLDPVPCPVQIARGDSLFFHGRRRDGGFRNRLQDEIIATAAHANWPMRPA
jgi:hypothetical protein